MSHHVSARLRLVAPAVFIAALTFGSLPAAAQTAPTSASSCSMLHFELANPNPGDTLSPGGYVLEGVARDTRATQGTGIDHIDFFLGDRDSGGANVGSVLPGLAGPLGPGSFSTIVDLPNLSGGFDLVGYAHSSVTDQEAMLAVPIVVSGVSNTDSGSTSTPTVGEARESCTGSATAAPAPSAPTAAQTSVPAPVASTSASTPAAMPSSITVQVANPEPNGSILSGAYAIEGSAWDTAATQGTGIEHIDVFLDKRDDGGMRLGTTTPDGSRTWHIVVDLPSNHTGPHSLWFYAQSSVTDAEKAVEVPVSIEE